MLVGHGQAQRKQAEVGRHQDRRAQSPPGPLPHVGKDAQQDAWEQHGDYAGQRRLELTEEPPAERLGSE